MKSWKNVVDIWSFVFAYLLALSFMFLAYFSILFLKLDAAFLQALRRFVVILLFNSFYTLTAKNPFKKMFLL